LEKGDLMSVFRVMFTVVALVLAQLDPPSRVLEVRVTDLFFPKAEE